MNSRTLIAILVLLVACATWAAAGKEPMPVTDDSLTDAVRRKLANDPVVKGGAFDVEIKGGAVVLRGKVEQEKQKERATKLVHKVKGVKSVDNKLTVVGKGQR